MTEKLSASNSIALDLQSGMLLAVEFLRDQEVNIDFELVSYHQLAAMDFEQSSLIDVVMLGPDSKELSNFEYLNQIRKSNSLLELLSFTIWQDIQNNAGISANLLKVKISDLTNTEGNILFSNIYRLWQAHVNLTQFQETNPTLNFAQFVTQSCQVDSCQHLLIYPKEQALFLSALQQSDDLDIQKLLSLSVKWVLINATLKQTMLFSAFNDLSILGFYHYQQEEQGDLNLANDWLVEHYLTQYSSAPNQYVALGFQSILQVANDSRIANVLDVENNQLQWELFSVKFQQGWPVLFEVSM
ncbi:hypothetical protein [Marinicellulosiphila megalodicopiae]|uniref:hypothetical protein n=1 Tax=Marinicellulosiphila megalodicopiae TaxID=2724896 RepID=UPI003BAFD058